MLKKTQKIEIFHVHFQVVNQSALGGPSPLQVHSLSRGSRPTTKSEVDPFHPGFLCTSFLPDAYGLHPCCPPSFLPDKNTWKPQANPRNRLSKFVYTSGDPAATLASEEVLITTVDKPTGIHAAGWVDFKPSDFANVSPQIQVVGLKSMQSLV